MRVTKHHKSLYARFLSFSLSVVLCLTLFAGTAWTQNGAHEWGYERNSGSAERMREAIRIFNQASPVALAAESITDSVLQTFAVSEVEGHRIFHIEDRLSTGYSDFFWVVDATNNTYSTIRMSWDINSDSQRIFNAVSAKLPQSSYTLARIKQAVAAVHSLKLGLVADQEDRNAGASFTANSDDPDYPNCWGDASATIVTYDPVPIMLTYTTSYAHWYYPGNGTYISTGGGECWANPDSDAGTSWFVDSCKGTHSSDAFHSRHTTWNRSYNYDFGFDNLSTWVLQKSEVRHDNGWARYVTSHKDWGEGSELIYGYVLIAYASCG